MKRLITLVFAVALMAACCGCGQSAPQKWTLTFLDDDGSLIEQIEVTASDTGSSVEGPRNVKKDGYKLTGWQADVSEDKARIKPSYSGNNFIVTVFADGITFTAQWEAAKTWNVTFTDGEGNVLGTAKVADGGTAEAPSTPTKDGYVFAGWNPSVNGISADTTIDATWDKAWTVTFTDGNGNVLSTTSIANGKAATAPSAPKRDGFDFKSWDADFSNVTSDMTVNAVWSMKPTTGMNNALRSAQSYLKTMPFSYSGLIEQLEYEKYSYEEAVYAADNCGADWNEQAVKAAQQYLKVMPFSRDGLIEQLEYEGYTYDQAVYGVDKAGL